MSETSVKVVQAEYSAHELGNGIATETDVKLLVAGSGVTVVPKLDDEIIVGGTTLRITRVTRVNLQGTTLLYTLRGTV